MTSTSPDRAEHDERRLRLLDVVRERGLIQFPEPRELASGELSCDFIDGNMPCLEDAIFASRAA